MTAPTTRETADHAELARLAEAAIDAGDPFMSLGDVADWGEFHAAANPATVLALLSEIAALRVRAEEADALASKHFVALREKQDDAAILKHGKLEAERQRDELRKALEAICLEASRPGMKPQHLLRVIAVATTPVRALLADQGADQ